MLFFILFCEIHGINCFKCFLEEMDFNFVYNSIWRKTDFRMQCFGNPRNRDGQRKLRVISPEKIGR